MWSGLGIRKTEDTDIAFLAKYLQQVENFNRLLGWKILT